MLLFLVEPYKWLCTACLSLLKYFVIMNWGVHSAWDLVISTEGGTSDEKSHIPILV